VTATRRFPARFAGVCVGCGDGFDAGAEAGYVNGQDGIRCTDCLDDADQQARERPVRIPAPGSTVGPWAPTLTSSPAREETGAAPATISTAVVHPVDQAEVCHRHGPYPAGALDCPSCPDVPQDLSIWREEATLRGTDPKLVGDELLDVFAAGVKGHARSAQREIGPSGIGHPCDRHLGYFFAEVPHTGTEPLGWRQAVGTAVHSAGDDWAAQANAQRGHRWLTNVPVYVGDLYPGRPIHGHLDYLDVLTATVVDLKVPGPSQLKEYRKRSKPESPTYRIQTQLYAHGVDRAGFLPEWVAILRVPMAGELLPDSVYRFERYQPEVAKRALERAGGIARMADALGANVVRALPATDVFCHRCPWFSPGSTDLTRGCPGAEGSRARKRDSLFEWLDDTPQEITT
jgi:hypothetical protein